ncbi:MAG: winged helix-turn-helix domain-containing protein [Candidatus Pacebacteria bacterium]|nr:winged helix-turn-helix domain-containing protein [Candidatus Paceibacterota bacterium]
MAIPNAQYEIPVLKALIKLGGRSTVQEIYPVVEKIMFSLLRKSPGEYGSHKSSKEPIWHNKTRWAREALKQKHELLGTEKGVWSITPLGRERIDLIRESKSDPDSLDSEDDKQNLLTEYTDFSEAESIEKVEEGRRLLRYHYVRERNPKIIHMAKQIALKKYGELRCEVCKFSFKEKYGKRTETYIEGHHRLSVRDMGQGHKTAVEDIALLCSNCHRAIHAKYPYISVEELKAITVVS